MGADTLSTAIALQALSRGCEDTGLVFSLCAHMLSCVVPIWKHGTEEQKRRYLPRLCDGSLIAVNAMSEPDSGSDVFSMSARAVAEGDDFLLTGRKIMATNGPIADLAVVYALTDASKGFHGGITAFLVEKGHPGFLPGANVEKMGLRTVPFGELVFDNVRLRPDAVLGRVGGGGAIFSESMEWERALLFASHVGVMERLLDRAIQRARTRKQFGQPIGTFQGVSHRIAEMKVHLEAARLLVYQAAWMLEHSRTASLEASVSKLFVSESLVEAALGTIQILGGQGYMTSGEVERALRDAVGGTLYSGTSEMQKNIIARWLGLSRVERLR